MTVVTGGALHVHSSALVGVEWLVKNVTYRPNCYICFTWDNSVRFLFSQRQPLPRWDCFYWQLLETLRAKIGDPTGFDNRFWEGLLDGVKTFFLSLTVHILLSASCST